MAKQNVWRGTMSVRRADGTLLKIAEVEDINGAIGEPKVTWLMGRKEREECVSLMMEGSARTAADFKAENGGPLLPDGRYKIMDLLRG